MIHEISVSRQTVSTVHNHNSETRQRELPTNVIAIVCRCA